MWAKNGPNTIQVQAGDDLGTSIPVRKNSEEASREGQNKQGTVALLIFMIKFLPENLPSF